MAVTEAEVGVAIASGAHSRDAVTRVCGAGGDCGACHGMIEALIEDHLDGACPGGESREPEAPAESGAPPRVAAAASGPELLPAASLVRNRAA